ncbi:unnamed protein product [Ilex paraguariensis]|uniref:Uncharacterized protein n=1 Tax=Ilex paraguariensis TaxID=185542 RepID=A0ABC8RJJ0_9AQUA
MGLEEEGDCVVCVSFWERGDVGYIFWAVGCVERECVLGEWVTHKGKKGVCIEGELGGRGEMFFVCVLCVSEREMLERSIEDGDIPGRGLAEAMAVWIWRWHNIE